MSHYPRLISTLGVAPHRVTGGELNLLPTEAPMLRRVRLCDVCVEDCTVGRQELSQGLQG